MSCHVYYPSCTHWPVLCRVYYEHVVACSQTNQLSTDMLSRINLLINSQLTIQSCLPSGKSPTEPRDAVFTTQLSIRKLSLYLPICHLLNRVVCTYQSTIQWTVLCRVYIPIGYPANRVVLCSTIHGTMSYRLYLPISNPLNRGALYLPTHQLSTEPCRVVFT